MEEEEEEEEAVARGSEKKQEEGKQQRGRKGTNSLISPSFLDPQTTSLLTDTGLQVPRRQAHQRRRQQARPPRLQGKGRGRRPGGARVRPGPGLFCGDRRRGLQGREQRPRRRADRVQGGQRRRGALAEAAQGLREVSVEHRELSFGEERGSLGKSLEKTDDRAVSSFPFSLSFEALTLFPHFLSFLIFLLTKKTEN